MKEKCFGVEKTETNQEILTGRVFRTGACQTHFELFMQLHVDLQLNNKDLIEYPFSLVELCLLQLC